MADVRNLQDIRNVINEYAAMSRPGTISSDNLKAKDLKDLNAKLKSAKSRAKKNVKIIEDAKATASTAADTAKTVDNVTDAAKAASGAANSTVPIMSKLKPLWGKLTGYIDAHPLQALGQGALGAMNVSGLFDNANIAGQLGGAALGGLAVPALASKFKIPYLGTLGKMGKINAALIGGGIGSLFDKLMAKKQEEEQMMQRYQGQY